MGDGRLADLAGVWLIAGCSDDLVIPTTSMRGGGVSWFDKLTTTSRGSRLGVRRFLWPPLSAIRNDKWKSMPERETEFCHPEDPP